MSASAIPAPTPSEQFLWALEHGSDFEFTLAARDWLAAKLRQHTAAAGCEVSDRQCDAFANNAGMALAELLRGVR